MPAGKQDAGKQFDREKVQRRVLVWLFWLIVWQVVSLLCGNTILLVGPWETLGALIHNVRDGKCWQTVLASCGRVLAGVAGGTLAGGLLAVLSYRYQWAAEGLRPFMTTVKAIPVASFSVLLLIWWGAPFLSVSISFLVVLPQIYLSTLSGLQSTDDRLLEMAQVFSIPFRNKAMYIYRPALRPFWESSFSLAIGMAWKSGVAAEVIGTPDYSIGERLYLSKIYLDTAEVFAWTAVTILLSACMEKVILWCLARFMKWEPGCIKVKSTAKSYSNRDDDRQILLAARKLHKRYGENYVVHDYSKEFEKGRIALYNSPSGSGKTTLFRLLAGLEVPDKGEVVRNGSLAMVFQEDRLCEAYSAVKNVELVTGDRKAAKEALLKLLPGEALLRPCNQLSGGMRRRVALVRAVCAEADCLLLDEPFAGLDEANRQKMMDYILEECGQKIVLLATHDAVLTHCNDKMDTN